MAIYITQGRYTSDAVKGMIPPLALPDQQRILTPQPERWASGMCRGQVTVKRPTTAEHGAGGGLGIGRSWIDPMEHYRPVTSILGTSSAFGSACYPKQEPL
jgi:hypothetical protein